MRLSYKQAYTMACREIEAHYSKYRSDQYSIFRGRMGIKPQEALRNFELCDFYAQFYMKRLDHYRFYKAPRYAYEQPQDHLPQHLRMITDSIKILSFLDDISQLSRRGLKKLDDMNLDISTESLLFLQEEVSGNHELITNHLEMFIMYFHPAFALRVVCTTAMPMYTLGGASDVESLPEEKGEQPAIIIDSQRDEEQEKASCLPCRFFGKKAKKEEPLFRESRKYSPD